MKLIYVVLDGLGDKPSKEWMNRTPLEEAKTPNMDFLARKGKSGLMYTIRKGVAPESDAAIISLLGYDAFKYSTGRGVLEAIGSGLEVNDGDLSLRCNFATLGSNKKIVDRRVGRDLSTKEATELSKAINEEVKLESHPAQLEFKNTIGHRCVVTFKIKGYSLSSEIQNTDPAYSRIGSVGVADLKADMVLRECRSIEKSKNAEVSAELVNEFTEKSHYVLKNHEINKSRVAEGRLEANVILSRDASHLRPKFFDIGEKYKVSFVSLTDMPVERGISNLAGMHMVPLPPPSSDLRIDCKLRVAKLFELLSFYDCFYVHIKGPDEPGHDGNFQLKTKLVSVIDKWFFEELLQKIDLKDSVICVTADHSTPCIAKAHTDDPVPLLVSGGKIQKDGTSSFSEKECRKGSLGIFDSGVKLMPFLMELLKQ